jgi:hypothetical protein
MGYELKNPLADPNDSDCCDDDDSHAEDDDILDDRDFYSSDTTNDVITFDESEQSDYVIDSSHEDEYYGSKTTKIKRIFDLCKYDDEFNDFGNDNDYCFVIVSDAQPIFNPPQQLSLPGKFKIINTQEPHHQTRNIGQVVGK